MYRRPKFLEKLIEIRREMAREADYDVDLFAELARTGRVPGPPRLRLATDREEQLEIAADDDRLARRPRRRAS